MSRSRELYETVYKFDSTVVFEDYPRNRVLARMVARHELRGKRFLDVGCNDGVVMEFFRGQGCAVCGIDISDVALARARERGLTDVVQGSVEDPFPWGAAEFDLAFWGDNVEHLFEPLRALKEINRVLKPGGTLWVSTPNTAYWKARLVALLKGAPMRTEGHVNPPWAWEHIRFFNLSILREFLDAGGFDLEACHGVPASTRWGGGASLFPGVLAPIVIVTAKSREPGKHAC